MISYHDKLLEKPQLQLHYILGVHSSSFFTTIIALLGHLIDDPRLCFHARAVESAASAVWQRVRAMFGKERGESS